MYWEKQRPCQISRSRGGINSKLSPIRPRQKKLIDDVTFQFLLTSAKLVCTRESRDQSDHVINQHLLSKSIFDVS